MVTILNVHTDENIYVLFCLVIMQNNINKTKLITNKSNKLIKNWNTAIYIFFKSEYLFKLLKQTSKQIRIEKKNWKFNLTIKRIFFLK